MIVLRLVDCAIDLRDPISGSRPENILATIKRTYEKKCYDGCMILRVIEITRTGFATITRDGRPSFATIPVTFKAECLIYSPGDVITGCKVTVKDDIGVTCEAPTGYVKIDMSPEVKPINVGMTITVRVAGCLYQPYGSYIVIGATLFLPTNKPIVYKICPQVGTTPAGLYDSVNERIAAEEAQLAELRGKSQWKFFHALVSAASVATPKHVDIKTGALDANFVVVDPSVSVTFPVVLLAAAPPPDSEPTAADLATARLYLLENYCTNLRVLREMSEIYNEKVVKENMALWSIYKRFTPK